MTPKINKSVLIVEDDQNFLELLYYLLEDKIATLECSRSFSHAKSLLEKQIFDVVVTDYHLGNTDFSELIDMIERADHSPAVVVMTGDVLSIEEIKRKHTIKQVIIKPFACAELVSIIENLR